VRIATWNSHYSFRSSRAEEAASWLDSLGAEVMLLQEAPDPGGGAPYEQVTSPGRSPWGTAIRGNGRLALERVALPKASVPGGAVVAETASVAGPVTFISVYGVFETFLKTIWSIPSLHRIVSDLTPLLVDRSRGGRIVLGGDFNASVSWDKDRIGGLGSHSLLFDRLEAFGLKSVLPFRDPNNLMPTWRRGGGRQQSDYMFVSESLEHEAAEVVWSEDGLSDHAVVLVDIDLPDTEAA
jgi:endonuclease/exonuclease/phosphatase family metal-dependent hydrolase